MACSSPMSVPRPNGKGSQDRITVPCGKCPECLSVHRQSWAFRLSKELKASKSAVFLTLTYDNMKLPIKQTDSGLVPTLKKRDIQTFLKRLRKKFPSSGLRYYLTAEYGSKTKRPHYHAIIFNLPFTEASQKIKLNDILRETWQNGHVYLGTVTDASIGYVTKYLITKHDDYGSADAPFSLMSKRPAIGFNYLKTSYEYHKPENGQNRFFATIEGGKKIYLPRYYRDKIFTKEEKEQNSAIQISLADQKFIDRYNEILEAGENPCLNEFIGLQQKHETMKKRLTKNSKL